MIVILLFCAVVGMASAALVIVGVSLYEIFDIKRSRAQSKAPRPDITLIVRYHNKDDLHRVFTIAEIPYKKLMIIVINQTGNSHVARTVRKYRHQKVAVFSSKKPFAESIAKACKKYHRNGPVILLGDRATIDDVSLETALHYISQSRDEAALLNRYYITHFTIGGLLRSYHHSVEQLWLKTCSVFRLPMNASTDDTVIYQRVQDLQAYAAPASFISGSSAFIEYDTGIFGTFRTIVFTKLAAWKTIKPLQHTVMAWLYSILRGMQQLAFFTLPILFGYFVFVALRLHQPVFLLVSVALVLMTYVYALWSDGQLEITDKLRYALQLPVICLLLPLLLAVPFIAASMIALKFLTNVTKAKVPGSVGLFVRVKDILRIV
jgi:hypothetical protein